ncbi:3'-phosphoadenylsulfate reductase [Cryptotrichosporon argae]
MTDDVLTPQYSSAQIDAINAELDGKTPQDVLRWAVDNVEGLFQTTAFGLTGLAALDMISKISVDREETHLVPLIFLDTLHHFPETLQLATTASETYLAPLHVYRPVSPTGTELESAAAFAAAYGDKLWETDEGSYDYLVKVEPAARAYKALGVRAVITGRRRSQGADRADLKVLEVDERGLLKVNPLIGWSFKEVKEYIHAENVPYNPLLDQGYRSIGDVHSTAVPDPSAASDASERSGRWQGKSKTECGLHTNYFEMKKRFEQRAKAGAAEPAPDAAKTAEA